MSAPGAPAARPLLEALRGVLSQLAEPSTVLRAILEQAVLQTGAQRGLFVEVAEAGGLTYQVLHGFAPKHFEGDAGRFSRRLFERVLESRQAIVLGNVLEHDDYRAVASLQALRVAAILCVPIEASGRVVALVHLEHPQPGHFQASHLDALRPLIEMAGPMLETLRAGRDLAAERDRLRDSESNYRGEAEASRRLLASEWSFGRFVGRSQPVRELEEVVRKAAATSFPVLIEGETGTGKSIVARVLHYTGPRAEAALVTVFCPSLERGMVEAELFGHKRGAFTGAATDRAGKLQAAEGGTLFLDEIGELPLDIQPKLLRLLQEKTYERIGDATERTADVRVIAATNRDLEMEVREGRFRRDLYERLNFLPIRLPPLRERTADLPLLLRHCLDSTEAGRWVELSPAAQRYLEELPFSWPGNVRHIEQLAARLTMEGLRAPVTPDDLSRLLGARDVAGAPLPAGTGATSGASLDQGLPRLLADAERAWIEEALRRHADLPRAEIAAKLRISKSAFYAKLKQYGLSDEP